MTTHTLITQAEAQGWLRSWDTQQATYFADREERFEVIGDVLQSVLGRPDPLIVDLGIGPGSLSHRLLTRMPQARVIGVDMDPLLLGLCEAAYAGPQLRVVQADLRAADWLAALGLDRAPDAFVSTTALHWMARADLRRLMICAARALAPGGVIVDGDHLFEESAASAIEQLRRDVANGAARRAPQTGGCDWAGWWDAVEQAPELADLVAARARVDLRHEVARDDLPLVQDYLDAMRAGGCREVGQVWQEGDDRVVVGLR